MNLKTETCTELLAALGYDFIVPAQRCVLVTALEGLSEPARRDLYWALNKTFADQPAPTETAEANRALAARLGATMTAGVVVNAPQGAPFVEGGALTLDLERDTSEPQGAPKAPHHCKHCGANQFYYSPGVDNFYCRWCQRGAGNEFHAAYYAERDHPRYAPTTSGVVK